MHIDYNKIITRNNYLAMDEDRYYELRELANYERSYILKKYIVNNISEVLNQKAHDIAYSTYQYHTLNDEEKALLAANIVFDDKKFVSILTKGKFELASLETYVKLISYMAYKVKHNMIDSEDDKRYLNTTSMYTQKLVTHFKKNVGNVEPIIIVNKLNEIVTLKKELLIESEKKRIR